MNKPVFFFFLAIVSFSLKAQDDKLIRRTLNQNTFHSVEKNAAYTQQPGALVSTCMNSDFEAGSYTGWSLSSGNINGVILPCYSCASGSVAIATITSASNSGATWTNGADACTGLPVVAPDGGNYSLALNNNTSGGKLQDAKYTFGVSSANSQLTFSYLVVLQNSGHPANQSPYFMFRLLDSSGTEIPGTKDTSSFSADTTTGWLSAASCGAYYKNWTSVCFDLITYIGQNVTLEVQISDCSQGGHYSYAYIDASCSSNAPCGTTGLNKLPEPPGLVAYPNPTNSSFVLRSKNKMDDMRITDITGRVVYTSRPGASETTVHLETEGMYFIQVNSEGKLNTIKLVVSK
jgi:hypothetical protein